ncbi:phage protein Gp27 family protein [Sphingopyxis sp. GW247-27LB]|uniref:phage protein Gp27 family protein n=1 Tax=Sphingopyxis sp. GW247-27LB TaxID=2012632 RepID=UPI000BA626A6|nr:phage protein Gp27 family protein [Sphingopyxis sp. GW247-27LB]PAL25489.1 hypothetical protein CD928_03175 [Sphingopyxis sp. GW247-27LB]
MARRPARPTRHRPSSIDKLDFEVRELIGKLRMDHGWTIDEIRQRLLDMGQSVSRSALGRHVRTLEDISAEMREAQAMATALAREVGDADQSRMLDVNAQLLQANMFKLMLAANEEDGEGVQLGAKDAKAFADALRSIALTRKTDLDLVERAEARAVARDRAAQRKKLDDAGRSGRLDVAALEEAKRILGYD